MRPILAILMGLLAALTLSGCGGGGKPQVAYNAPLALPDNADFVPADVQSRIMPLDMLTITIYQFPDLSGDFQVSVSGNIELPVLGTVLARDKTTEELQDELKTRFGAKYLKDPQIRISSKSNNPRMITVDGSVIRPGMYPLQGKLTLIQAVALAGGPSELANPKRVVVFRQISGSRAAAAFDLQAIRAGRIPNPDVYGNDIIVVDGSDSKSKFRDVVRTLPLLTLFTLL